LEIQWACKTFKKGLLED